MTQQTLHTRNSTSLPLFISLLPFLYYIDYAKKLYRNAGFPRMHDFSFEILLNWIQTMTLADWRFWIGWIIYPAIYIAYALLLFRYANKIESVINETFRKLLPIILPVIFTVVIIGNAALLGGNSNAMIMTKLGWCWGIGLVLFAGKLVDFKKLTSGNINS